VLEKASLIDSRNPNILLGSGLRQKMRQFPTQSAFSIGSPTRPGNLKALKCLRDVYLESGVGRALRPKDGLKYTKGKQAEEEETFFYLGLSLNMSETC